MALRTVKPLVARLNAKRPRESARARGYTAAWDREAKAFKAAYPLCLGCQAVGRVAATEVVDHIEPHKGDERRFWDRANWQPCCAWHHDVVKKRLEDRYLRGQAAAADLRLDSAMASALTREQLSAGPRGVGRSLARSKRGPPVA